MPEINIALVFARVSELSKAFVHAWTAACGARGASASLLVPAAKSFLVGPTEFRGPCAATRITVQVRTSPFLIWA
jgi:hypothetical protein